MTTKEKEILKKLVEHPGGLLSPADFINGIAGQDKRAVHHLVVEGYAEEVPQEVKGIQLGTTNTVNFYRATEKGLAVFEPWHRRAWVYFKGDIRTVVISLITSAGTAIVTILIGRALS